VLAEFDQESGKHTVRYDDGDTKQYDMAKRKFVLEGETEGESKQEGKQEGAGGGGIAALRGGSGGSGGDVRTNKYRDYYFMPQFEVGQQELVDVHHYTYIIDKGAMGGGGEEEQAMVQRVNQFLANHIYFSTQKRNDYDKFLTAAEFRSSRRHFAFFQNKFMSTEFLDEFIGLGFAETNPKEKDINSLTQTVRRRDRYLSR
jgi:hypothetical protein